MVLECACWTSTTPPRRCRPPLFAGALMRGALMYVLRFALLRCGAQGSERRVDGRLWPGVRLLSLARALSPFHLS